MKSKRRREPERKDNACINRIGNGSTVYDSHGSLCNGPCVTVTETGSTGRRTRRGETDAPEFLQGNPGAQQQMANEAGYAVFSDTGFKAMFMGGVKGKGWR